MLALSVNTDVEYYLTISEEIEPGKYYIHADNSLENYLIDNNYNLEMSTTPELWEIQVFKPMVIQNFLYPPLFNYDSTNGSTNDEKIATKISNGETKFLDISVVSTVDTLTLKDTTSTKWKRANNVIRFYNESSGTYLAAMKSGNSYLSREYDNSVTVGSMSKFNYVFSLFGFYTLQLPGPVQRGNLDTLVLGDNPVLIGKMKFNVFTFKMSKSPKEGDVNLPYAGSIPLYAPSEIPSTSSLKIIPTTLTKSFRLLKQVNPKKKNKHVTWNKNERNFEKA
jgi:hypothetical protein